jgi:hypothetical protein
MIEESSAEIDSIDGAVEVREKIAAAEREKYQKDRAPISHELLHRSLKGALPQLM